MITKDLGQPLNVFEFINNQQQKLYRLEESNAPLEIIRKEELIFEGMNEVYTLLKEWLKWLKSQNKIEELKIYSRLNEIIND